MHLLHEFRNIKTNHGENYIGLMSGTSIDGIDVAIVKFTKSQCQLIASLNYPIPSEVKQNISKLSSPRTSASSQALENRIELMAEMDVIMGNLFADSVNAILKQENLSPSDIIAIGSHGQTLRHRPTNKNPFTLQIGDPNIIAEKTGITTVADFRRMDIAAGGQGAPLAPAFHNAILRSSEIDRIILNLGGIANITLLPKNGNKDVLGFDTGTANTLLDAWYKKYHPNSNDDFDRNSSFAKKGQVNKKLLQVLLSDPFFQLPYPKSTGREHFCLDWLLTQMKRVNQEVKPEDVQRTLIEFTTDTIADAIESLKLSKYQILACGGGMHNHFILNSLSEKLDVKVLRTNDFDVDGDYLEAMAFAWFAKQRMEEKPGNLPSVTGATKNKILGAIYHY